MSASTEFKIGPGIPTEQANEAREEILAENESTEQAEAEGKPVIFIDHKSKTRAASNGFLEKGDKTGIAEILGIPLADVLKRFRGSQPGISNSIECTVKPGRTDLAYTILALGDLSVENGLPALGSSKSKPVLASGEALHFTGDLQQTYSGVGGGTLIWFQWSNLSGSS